MFDQTQPSYRRLQSIIAERTNRLVIWVGAGLSMPAGLPSWSELKDTLCRTLVEKAPSDDPKEVEAAKKRADQARQEKDNWLAFQMLREAIGPATYRATIREAFNISENCKIPDNYSLILDLPVTGILNLNLDRLATRAYTKKRPGEQLIEFPGFQAGQYLHVLKGSAPFIVNLHGTLTDENSWVLTRDEMRALLQKDGYKEFVHMCLGTRTVVFVGISATDVTVGGHLETLTDAKIDLGDHFWITNRANAVTDYWAEHVQLQVIRYRSRGDDHSELSEMLSLLGKFEPKDEDADPVTMTSIDTDVELPSPDKLRQEADLERLRQLLNAHAATILNSSSESSHIDYKKYDRFCERYDEAIYRAWYVTQIPPRNKLFGYTLKDEVASGAFGRVFRAQDPKGGSVAIKVLREEIRRKPDMLQSFRRGVRSMRILAQRQVKGMIPYEEASEIPTVAIMKFVEGPNLQEAVHAGYCEDWLSILDIAVQIANIIRRAHLLPERVLHRDLRPPNIMLKDYYINPDTLNVVVLDFDLSWHLGSQEMSAILQSNSGFLAPEQVDSSFGMSTRSAAVDSYGIGMTLYYLRTGKEPQYLHHLHANWREHLWESILAFPCKSWHSLPVRYARLILNSTKHSQSQRWDMGQIEGELELLKESLLFPKEVRSGNLLVEELTHRIFSIVGSQQYRWDPNRLCAELDLASGVRLTVISDESNRQIKVKLEWSNRGDRDYKNVRKYLPPAIDRAIDALRAQNWTVLPSTHLRSSEAGFEVSLKVEQLAATMQEQAKTIANVVKDFEF